MPIIRREIHPVVRVLSEERGLVEYVASNESLDSYQEIIKADGWRFDDFKKNSPFVDSHDYSSIKSLLGRVVDFKVQGSRLVETVQWAIDVVDPTGHPSHLAQWGFNMTVAGYLKAVSVGFMPVRAASPFDRDPSAWREACEDIGLDPAETPCRCIYLEQQQKELSACVIGANPDALAKSYRAGILTDDMAGRLAHDYPEFGRKFERAVTPLRRTAYSVSSKSSSGAVEEMLTALGKRSTSTPTPTTSPTMQKTNLLQNFDHLGSTTKGAFEGIEAARRNGNHSEIERALRRALAELGLEKRSSFGDPIARYFERNPEQRLFWNGIARKFAGCLKLGSAEYNALAAAYGGAEFAQIEAGSQKQRAISGINLQDAFGAGLLLAVPVANEVYDLLISYGAYKDLGLRKMVGQYMSYPKATGWPTAVFITPNQQGKTTIPADTTLTGAEASPAANTIASLITVSREWLADETVDLSEVVFSKFINGTAQCIDYGAFQGNGNDDQQNGMTIGIFANQAIQTSYSAKGAGMVSGLQRSDFLNAISTANPAVLQRMIVQSPRWYISPSFIPQLLGIKDGTGPQYLLKTPAETQGEWLLCGFPVTWAGQAPSVNKVGSKVAAFGNPDAYLVALHEHLEIMLSQDGPAFASNQGNFRSVIRGQSLLREVTGFVTLTLQ